MEREEITSRAGHIPHTSGRAHVDGACKCFSSLLGEVRKRVVHRNNVSFGGTASTHPRNIDE